MSKIYWYPLSKEERARIRSGAVVSKNFNMDPLATERLLMVMVGKTKIPKEQCRGAMKAGISCTSIVLTDADLAKIEAKDGVFAQYPDFQVGVVSQEAFDELQKLKKGAS